MTCDPQKILSIWIWFFKEVEFDTSRGVGCGGLQANFHFRNFFAPHHFSRIGRIGTERRYSPTVRLETPGQKMRCYLDSLARAKSRFRRFLFLCFIAESESCRSRSFAVTYVCCRHFLTKPVNDWYRTKRWPHTSSTWIHVRRLRGLEATERCASGYTDVISKCRMHRVVPHS